MIQNGKSKNMISSLYKICNLPILFKVQKCVLIHTVKHIGWPKEVLVLYSRLSQVLVHKSISFIEVVV